MTLGRRRQRREEFIEIIGTPDMVLEVLSDSSVRKDLVRLKAAYERAGVPEYWVVDARGEQISVSDHDAGGRSLRVRRRRADQPQASRVLGARFALHRTRNRLGRYAYTLEIS